MQLHEAEGKAKGGLRGKSHRIIVFMYFEEGFL